jgi:hypothetical protein
MRAPVLVFASVLALAGATLLPGAVSAQLNIPRFTVDGGGGMRSVGGTYSVSGTIAQPDAGTSSGGSYSITGGFWMGGGVVSGVPDGDPGDGVDPPVTAPPLTFRIYPASPNPVEENMVFAFDLPETRLVRVSLYDSSGRLMRTLADGPIPAGRHQRVWNRRDQTGNRVPAGIYFVRMDAGAHRSHQKIVVMQ